MYYLYMKLWTMLYASLNEWIWFNHFASCNIYNVAIDECQFALGKESSLHAQFRLLAQQSHVVNTSVVVWSRFDKPYFIIDFIFFKSEIMTVWSGSNGYRCADSMNAWDCDCKQSKSLKSYSKNDTCLHKGLEAMFSWDEGSKDLFELDSLLSHLWKQGMVLPWMRKERIWEEVKDRDPIPYYHIWMKWIKSIDLTGLTLK